MIQESQDIAALLDQIRSGKEGRDAVISQLYYDQSLIKRVHAVIYKYGGNKEDFDEVFNQSLMQFVKSVVRNREMVISTDVHSYISGISKFVWLGELKKRGKHTTANIDDQYDLADDYTPETLLIDHSKKEIITTLLERLGRNCKEVLLHWANGYKMAEIADIMKYKSEGMVRKKKYQCFKELLSIIETNPQIKTILK